MKASQVVAELLGTFIFVFFMGMCRISSQEDIQTYSFCTFFLMVALVHSMFQASSSIFNPILALSLIVTKQIKFSVAIVYVILHLLGSFLAGSLLFVLNKGKESGTYYGSPQMNAALRTEAMIFEMIAMFILVMVYSFFMSNPSAPKNVYGTAIAGTYLLNIISFSFISGGALNFSLVFGPSIFQNNFKDWGYYILGQLVGGVVGGIIYRLFLQKNELIDDIDEDELDEELDQSSSTVVNSSKKQKVD